MKAGNLLVPILLRASTELHGNMIPSVSSSINMMKTGRKFPVEQDSPQALMIFITLKKPSSKISMEMDLKELHRKI